MKKNGLTYIVIIVSAIALAVVTVVGVLSFQLDGSYVATNQYGEQIKMFGSGIYANDSYFRAPIFVGSDVTMLLVVLPLLVFGLLRDMKNKTLKSRLFLASVLGVVLYYGASISFGVVYNQLHLVYIALFSTALFGFISVIRSIDLKKLREAQTWRLPSTGLSIFLVLTGLALFVAWLPDIIPTLAAGTPLAMIEVYTTEITYVIDMGIISPMIFLCLYMLKKKDGLGQVLLSVTLTLCGVMGIMLPVQSVFQIIAGIEIPVPVLVTKVGIFVLLALFAAIFFRKYYKNLSVS